MLVISNISGLTAAIWRPLYKKRDPTGSLFPLDSFIELIYYTDMTNALAIAKQIDAVLLPDNQQWTNRFEIKSASSSRLYTIAQRKSDHSWGCSCPGWKRHRNCKHLSHLQLALSQLGRSR